MSAWRQSDATDPPVTADVEPMAAELPRLHPDASDDRGMQTVSQPSRVLRLAAMTQALVVQTRDVELDAAARHRLAGVFNHTVEALRELVSEDLQGEIDRLDLHLPDDPTDAELRVAQAQLVGWLEGLFHGIRTTVLASHLATQEELERAFEHGVQSAEHRAQAPAVGSYL